MARNTPIAGEENKALALKKAIQEGLESPRVENFDFDEYLKQLKDKSRNKNHMIL